MAALGIAVPTQEPAATQHVPEIVAFIARLIELGLAYPSGGDVYFSVPSFSSYGALSGQSVDDLKSGARIEVGELKRSPLDFALWKGVKPGEPSWPSPWGEGRPGWHIECSAMAHTFLGEVFDIHGGGSDLIFPHHENERAQSEGAFGAGSFARHWMHAGMVNFGGEKMSKSLGNFVTIKKVRETHDLEALRLLVLGVHYRSPVSFTLARDEQDRPQYPDLDEAEARLDYFYRTLERLDQVLGDAEPSTGGLAGTALPAAQGTWDRFREAMDDDFNTAAALADFYEGFVLAKKLLDDAKSAPKDVRKQSLALLRADLRRAGSVLGIFQRPAAAFLLARRERQCQRRGIDPASVEQEIVARTTARATKDFAAADAVRMSLKARNIELMDTPQGTTWRVV
jgi:cysteinyl-tRNA synthetase